MTPEWMSDHLLGDRGDLRDARVRDEDEGGRLDPLFPVCAQGLGHRVVVGCARAGKRGEGKWKRITWDEAYDLMAPYIPVEEKEEMRGLAHGAGIPLRGPGAFCVGSGRRGRWGGGFPWESSPLSRILHEQQGGSCDMRFGCGSSAAKVSAQC